MILEFSIKNYRSFKEECTFSLVAESGKSKSENVFEHEMSNGDKVRLLKSAVIYGPNASGKSNLLKGLETLKKIVGDLAKAGEPIQAYDPFLFDQDTRKQPTYFSISFIGPKNHKYFYEIEYDKDQIIKENLDYFPKGQTRSLFKRSNKNFSEDIIHIVQLGQDHKNKTLKAFKNQTVLSKFGTDEPDEFFTPIYLYFQNTLKIQGNLGFLAKIKILEKLNTSPLLLNRLNNLIRVTDTKIEGIVLKETGKKHPTSVNGRFELIKGIESKGKHSVFHKNKKIEEFELPFNQESRGTNVLFSLGTLILETLEEGGIFLVDEIDTSLHPKLAKFLVQLFQHPRSNPKNAQLIFTTHETTFLDKDLFRKDQIWFVEKDKFGGSDLSSVQDFDGVREDTPFEKWYLAGKFGGTPNIQEIEFIYGEEN